MPSRIGGPGQCAGVAAKQRIRHMGSPKGHTEVQPHTRSSDTIVVQINLDKNTILDSRKCYIEEGIGATDGG